MKPKPYFWPVWISGKDSRMLLSAIDPALLMYQQEHWQTRQPHFFSRIRALALHRNIIRRYNQQIAISNEIAALVQQLFPWREDYKIIGELRDLRQFILEEFVRAHFITKTRRADEISLQPSNLTCGHIENIAVLDIWKELLCACVEEETNTEFDVQVATWETPVHLVNSQSVTITVSDDAGSEDYNLPLVWDENSWANRLHSQDPWPDLQRCAELYFKANFGMQSYPQAREHPIPFEWTDTFWKSLDDLCQPRMRHLLVKAIAKKVYGILDSKLSDEPLGQIRRFRVTDFWRVHYRQLNDRIVLEEFGEHDMGL